MHKSSRSESKVPNSFHWLWPKPLLCSTAVRGAQITSKAVVICYLPIFFVQNTAEFGGFLFCKPRSVCHGLDSTTGCYWHTQYCLSKKKREPDSPFWASKPGAPLLWFFYFPLHSPRTEPRYNNRMLGLFLLQK